jgi:hypothetical protein
MTNRFEAHLDPMPGGGYRVFLRFAKDGEPKPLLERDDKPSLFPTKTAALEECVATLLRYLNGNLRSESMAGEGIDPNGLFPSLKPVRRNGRVIPVSTNKRVRV